MQLGTYQHYKGNLYQVTAFALNSDTQQEMVIYKPLYKTDIISEDMFFVRDKKIFLEIVEINGEKKPRFIFLHS
jgi:hypothetical protein